ncbi:MAG: adenylate/guanylate cyclase domain-containing protein [Verrucomicrobiales bacterium]|nr:adenylate/guanylate cyclase domain-containing protein [Verrucomicrobiales bacterium]
MSSTLLKSLLLGFAGILIGFIHQFEPFAEWEEATVDFRLQHRPKEISSGAVGIVAVGDEDIASDSFGGWPFPRGIHADVINILREFGASQIAFDVMFSDPDKNGQDESLANALAAKDDITLAYHFEDLVSPGESTSSEKEHFMEGNRYGVDVSSSTALAGVGPIKPIFSPSSMGAVNFNPSGNSGTVRRIPLFIQHGGKLYPGLAMESLIRHLGLEPDQIRIAPGRQISLIDTSQGNLTIPIDDRLQYRINYTSKINDFDPAFQYLDLYRAVHDDERGVVFRAAVEGKPVIIGDVSTGTSDIVSTPIGRLPGMLTQATVMANILDQNHLKFLEPSSQIAGSGLLGIFLVLLFRLRSAAGVVLASISLLVGYLILAYWLAKGDWMIPVLPVVEMLALSMIGSLWFQIAQARDETGRTLRALKKYVSPSVAERALREETFSRIEPERREITVFFSDIRGFTNWSEKKEPEEVTMVLNDYLKSMTEIVDHFGGTLDKFVGDCVMVIFNSPDACENHPVRAVEMAVAMQERIQELSDLWRKEGRDPIDVGMGISTGFATVGNFGSEAYSDFTAIGNCVNLAARVESESEAGEILVSEATKRHLEDAFETLERGVRQLKGIREPVKLYSIERNKSAAVLKA